MIDKQEPSQENQHLSRRKLLAALGISSAALASGMMMNTTALAGGSAVTDAVYRNGQANEETKEKVICTTIAMLRSNTAPNPPTLCLIEDDGQQGFYAYDPADTTTPDNTGTVLVSASGARFKRLYDGSLNVTWFGAKGDGVTDDTAAVQLAIDALSSTDSSLLFPNGVFVISSPLLLSANMRLEGKSKSRSVLIAVGDITVLRGRNQETGRIDNITLQNMSVTRSDTGSPSAPLIDWTRISHSRISDVSIMELGTQKTAVGLKLGAYSYYNMIEQVQARHFDVGVGLYDEANGNTIIGGACVSCNIGFVVSKTNSTRFMGSSAELCTNIGYLLTKGSKKNQLFGCRAEAMPICYKIEWMPVTPAFDNFVIGCLGYPNAGGKLYDSSTSNTILDTASWYAATVHTSKTGLNVYKNQAQSSLPIATPTKIVFQSKEYDHLTEYDATKQRFTCKKSGMYLIQASVLWNHAAAGSRHQLYVYRNGTLYARIADTVSSAAVPFASSGSISVKLTAKPDQPETSDYIEIFAEVSAAGIGVTSGPTNTYLNVTEL